MQLIILKISDIVSFILNATFSIISGWIRLQNGYYLPMASDDGEITFLHQVSTEIHAKSQERESLGSETPLFRHSSIPGDPSKLSELKLALETAVSSLSLTNDEAQMFNVRPAIHMDAMAFGMGCCCLQITFQATDVDESRFLYDQLAVMAPIMMALTASTPVLRGRLADTDCRWGIISECVDDRRPAERGRKGGPEPDPEVAGKGLLILLLSYFCTLEQTPQVLVIFMFLQDIEGYTRAVMTR